MSDNVNHPSHYKGVAKCAHCGGEIEAIVITENLGFCLGNSVKYILRSGKKKSSSLTDKEKRIEDLKKSIWYVQREISTIEKEKD